MRRVNPSWIVCLGLVMVGSSFSPEAEAKGGGAARALARSLVHDNRYLLKHNPSALGAKLELLAGSPFIYYRAAAGRSYALARTLGQLRRDLPYVLGNLDLHINGNTGSVAGKKWRAVDQDEAGHPAPFTADLVRWGAGVFLAAKASGYSQQDAHEMVRQMAQSYVATLRAHPTIPTTPATHRELMAQARARAAAARKDKLKKDGRFKPNEKSRDVDAALARELDGAYARYLRSLSSSVRRRLAGYEIVDRIERVDSGGGSRGLLRYRLALVPKKAQGKAQRAQAIVLEIKEQPPSPAQDVFGKTTLPARSEAERVITMRRLQGAASVLDGVTDLAGRSFSVIEQRFDEATLDLTRLGSAEVRRDVARADGMAAAIAHMGSGLKREKPATTAKALLRSIDGGNFANAAAFAHQMAREAEALAPALEAQHALYVGGAGQRGALDVLRRYLRRYGRSK